MLKTKKKFNKLALSSKGNFGMKAVVGKPGPRHEEASLDMTTLSYKTANQSPDRRSFSRTQLTDQDADVAEKVIVDYQQSLQAMSDLS